MFTDLVGFSRHVERFGILHFLQIIHEHRKLLLPIVEEHDGLLVKQEGDSFLILFRRPERAVACAQKMQRACGLYNERRKPEEQIVLCVGIGFGRVLRIGDTDVWGKEVNAASKLGEDTAKGNEILVTEAVRKAFDESQSPHRVRARRRRDFAERIRVPRRHDSVSRSDRSARRFGRAHARVDAGAVKRRTGKPNMAPGKCGFERAHALAVRVVDDGQRVLPARYPRALEAVPKRERAPERAFGPSATVVVGELREHRPRDEERRAGAPCRPVRAREASRTRTCTRESLRPARLRRRRSRSRRARDRRSRDRTRATP